MIVSLKFKNVRPINKEIDLCMIPANGDGVLDLASIYGANGSGKSSLLDFILYLKEFVLGQKTGSRLLTLDEKSPGEISVGFITPAGEYLFSLSFINLGIIFEELYKVTPLGNENIYTRNGYNTRYNNDLIKCYTNEKYLFLSTIIHHENFSDIKTWLKSLNFYSCFQDYPVLDNKVFFIVRQILYSLKIHLVRCSNGYMFAGEKGGYVSRGIQKLLYLLYFFIERILEKKSGVFFVDDFGVGLHPCIAIKIIELFKRYSEKHKNVQVIFSTHMTELMRFSLIPKEAIYLLDKDDFYSMNSFDSTYDKEVTKAYMQGLYGGIPEFDEG